MVNKPLAYLFIFLRHICNAKLHYRVKEIRVHNICWDTHDRIRMSATSRIKHRKFSDQRIQMQQLLPAKFPRQSKEYNMPDCLNSIIPYTTLRMHNTTEMSNEECASAIASHLQASNRFMQDDPASERFRMETFKAMPYCLTVKRSVKSQLLATVTRDTTKKSISYWKWLKYNISLKFTKMRMALRNSLSTCELWQRTIQSIESHSGSGVATYFKFLRWLLLLNIISCILSISFIVIPQSLDQTHVPNNIQILDFLTGSALLERYNNKRTELYVTVVRNHAVAATILGTLFAFWIIHSTSHCWQTDLGEEIYRLIVLDFIASVLGACLQFARFMLYKRLSTRVGRPEFDIARSTLNLIYNQTLFWMGFYFSPLMSLIIVVKLTFTFYVKKYQLRKCYQQPSQPWRAAQTQTLFLALAFLGMIGVLLTIGYVLTNVESNDCGPFRDHVHTWDFIVDGILFLKRDSAFWNVVTELARPVTGAAILVGMCIAVYCLRAKAEASKEMLQILSDMLLMQSQDKQFLMKSLAKLADEHAAAGNTTSLAEHSELIDRNSENEVSLSRRRNLPSTSFEEER
ncbi:transmembrane channel-like protein 5 isoform X3 [Ooceraea biroi]|uniref:transmembrane channel-like protein 5 isoform X3 n=1 Tax=Ooceraea biroi TaxID=2015173 RepID=UPI000F0830D8|nr:transmembrane channel-like protein 5 isoform X3 [Ooceraea biroi]